MPSIAIGRSVGVSPRKRAELQENIAKALHHGWAPPRPKSYSNDGTMASARVMVNVGNA